VFIDCVAMCGEKAHGCPKDGALWLGLTEHSCGPREGLISGLCE